MRLRAGARSDKGRVRALNEDAYACDLERGLFVVCDGMGGEAAGEVASQLAVHSIVSELSHGQNGAQAAAAASDGQAFMARTHRLGIALKLSNQAIYAESQKNSERARMGATAVSVWIEDSIASVAHVGDSRVYLCHGSHLEQLTRDHSLVEEQVRAGLLTRGESMQSEDQNVLLRVLGRESDVEVDLAEVPLMAGDYLLLCTDGLTRVVEDEALADALTTLHEPQEICDHLVALANRNGGPDNIAVVVVEVAYTSLWQRLWSRWRRS
ncbi:MAG: Stp1/IreP family PP2C-type Ser/Thr phosphatase [Terriglobia bacterium]